MSVCINQTENGLAALQVLQNFFIQHIRDEWRSRRGELIQNISRGAKRFSKFAQRLGRIINSDRAGGGSFSFGINKNLAVIFRQNLAVRKREHKRNLQPLWRSSFAQSKFYGRYFFNLRAPNAWNREA